MKNHINDDLDLCPCGESDNESDNDFNNFSENDESNK